MATQLEQLPGFPPLQVFKAKPDEDFAEADGLQRTPAAQRWEESRLAVPGWQDAEELMAWENHGKTMGKPWENGDLYSNNDWLVVTGTID